MKRDEIVEPPVQGVSEENLTRELKDISLELSWPLLDWEGEWPAWGPNLEPAGARALDEKCLARTQTWRRRSGRSPIRHTFRPSAN